MKLSLFVDLIGRKIDVYESYTQRGKWCVMGDYGDETFEIPELGYYETQCECTRQLDAYINEVAKLLHGKEV